MQYLPHKYQDHATDHIVANKYSGLFLEMGLGKTVATLTAISRLIYEDLEVGKVLVIAPKTVALNVWPEEVKKWTHLSHLRLEVVKGDPAQRVACLKRKADIYVIGRDNVAWIVKHYMTAFPFDMVVIDELSSFKDNQSQRFRSLRIVRPLIKRVVGLTGTPAPNGLQDLWPQIYLLDQGERLGKTIGAFREAYLSADKIFGQHIQSYKVRKGSEKEIYDKIGDICISMKADDYLELPGRLEHTIRINLEPATLQRYKVFEKEKVLEMASADISALNAAALTTKLLQFSNGALYDENRAVHLEHDQKLDALSDIIEEAGDQPVLVFYSYIHDKQRILERFKHARELKTSEDIKAWNSKKVRLMIAHPASAGHGLNLQAGGNIIVWFGLTWSLELYQQANARLDRQGQTKPVMIYKLICAGTMDEEVSAAIYRKADGQSALMAAVKAKIEFYRKKVLI